jgi:hypothetical protein
MLKYINQTNVYIINGNHEDIDTYTRFGLTEQQQIQFICNQDNNTCVDLNKVLFYLPSVIYLNFNNEWYHLSHGAFDTVYGGAASIRDNSESFLTKFLKSNTKYYDSILTDDNKFNKDACNRYQNLDECGQYNDFKWGDFFQQQTEWNKRDPTTGRNGFGPAVTEHYMNKNNIKCLIRGHQDLENLMLMIPSQKEYQKTIYKNLDEYKLKLNNGIYDLYSPSEIKIGMMAYCPDINKKFILHPGLDFTVLTTSTATITRDLCNDTYLILNQK